MEASKRVSVMKQALIHIKHPLKLSEVNEAIVDSIAWHVNVVVGELDGWRDVSGDAADIAWRDAARAVRRVAASVAGENETIYTFGPAAAERLADLVPKWSAEDSWVSPPRPSIPENTPEHDVIALKSPPVPLPDTVPGDVYKRVPVPLFQDEEWWPGRWSFGGTALSFPASPVEYRERLENALRLGDYDLARKLVMVSPGVSEAPPEIVINDFGSNPQLLDSVTLYVMAGAHAKCVVGVNFYFRRIRLTAFLASAMDVLTSSRYECYRSNGIETFKEWATSGRLPKGLAALTRDSVFGCFGI